MSIDNVVGIIGWPVHHSLSPAMHNRAFLEVGLTSWCYIAMPVSPSPQSRLQEAVLGLRALGCKGANVTIPYKEAVLPYLDRLSDTAKTIGAVNTIAIDDNDNLVGHNTDGDGFIKDICDHGIDVQKIRVTLLGAGGSARAIAYALLRHGCTHITIVNRTKSKAESLAYLFKKIFSNAHIVSGSLKETKITEADMIINATSVGLNNTQMPLDKNISFSSDQIVYDVIYTPYKTELLRHAKSNGAKIINGLGMLVHQGALSFEIWTKKKPPIAVMKSVVMKKNN